MGQAATVAQAEPGFENNSDGPARYGPGVIDQLASDWLSGEYRTAAAQSAFEERDNSSAHLAVPQLTKVNDTPPPLKRQDRRRRKQRHRAQKG